MNFYFRDLMGSVGRGVLPRLTSDEERLASEFPRLEADVVRDVVRESASIAAARTRLYEISLQQAHAAAPPAPRDERFAEAERLRQRDAAETTASLARMQQQLHAATTKNQTLRRQVLPPDSARSAPVKIPIADGRLPLGPAADAVALSSAVAASAASSPRRHARKPSLDQHGNSDNFDNNNNNHNDAADDDGDYYHDDYDNGDDVVEDVFAFEPDGGRRRPRRRHSHSKQHRSSPRSSPRHKRTHSAASSSTTAPQYLEQPLGLSNRVGENNCFLNVCIQSLYYLPPFRAALAEASSRKHRCPPDCVLCGLQSVFVQFAFGDSPQPPHRQLEQALFKPSISSMMNLPRTLVEQFTGSAVHENRAAAVPPTALRQALAALYAPQGRFQLHETDDAAEALDAILNELHASICDGAAASADVVDGQNCCVAHATFGMLVRERFECGKCGVAAAAPATFSQFVHYMSAAALRDAARDVPDLTFENVVRQLACTTPQRCDKCQTMGFIEPELVSAPQVLTIGFVWDSNSCSSDEIGATMRAVATRIDAAATFGAAKSQRYELRATLAYYGLHYVAFARNPATDEWAMFDDARVRVLGTNFASVVAVIERARLQPLLLFFERV